jgi:cysteinyl-tRNA synthetase
MTHFHGHASGGPFDTGIRARGAFDKKPQPLMVSDPNRATLYVCGVTVYDHCHLGHARSACAFDVIARHLRSRVGRLIFARNVTDIDDKIIRRARERGVDWRELARSMEQSMREDFDALGCERPDAEPRASEHIPHMIEHIERLVHMGLAYVDDEGGVWRDGSTWNGSGKISGRKPEELWAGARVEAHPGKRAASDFALWKAAKPGEPSWASPWGQGRPGWHIECSAMSRATLGDSLDAHGGGEDLKFPHHECECAQSEPVTGQELARHWLHNGFVVLPKADGAFEEMHKSTGNALNIKSLLAIHPGEAIRVWALSAHYRQPLPYSEGGVEAARARSWRWALAREAALASGARAGPSVDGAVEAALDADFNTPAAFARLDALSKAIRNGALDEAPGFLAALARLGLGKSSSADLAPAGSRAPLDVPEAAELIQEREKARARSDWARADELRDALLALGVHPQDGPSLKTKA